jgi:hypothetical protein
LLIISNEDSDISKRRSSYYRGGFLLEKGVGTLAGRGIGGSLSNRRVTSWSISS